MIDGTRYEKRDTRPYENIWGTYGLWRGVKKGPLASEVNKRIVSVRTLLWLNYSKVPEKFSSKPKKYEVAILDSE